MTTMDVLPSWNDTPVTRAVVEFVERSAFTYSILDGHEVIGCVYIYPSSDPGHDAQVRSWVTASRADMDSVVCRALNTWLRDEWPSRSICYASRP